MIYVTTVAACNGTVSNGSGASWIKRALTRIGRPGRLAHPADPALQTQLPPLKVAKISFTWSKTPSSVKHLFCKFSSSNTAQTAWAAR
eukprot:Skav230547  [mRNA]  locus=scaffold1365:151851:155008:- [translate_table: standard]